MSTKLRRIGEKARSDPQRVFTSLYHHICDVDNLRACFEALPGNRAVGVDGVTKEQYGAQLDANLEDLSARLKRMGYRPQVKRRAYIPKPGSEKGRPLAISGFEDKLVELAVKRVLEPIYEEQFEDSSHGYRPGCSQHRCLDDLGRTIQQKRINLEDGLVKASEEGTPQGSILSPLLSNIYLHYVLDLWFSPVVKPGCRGEAYYFRFADDFVACFQHQPEASAFMEALEGRLGTFSLTLAMEKTRCIAFGRFARDNARRRGQKPQEFTFLGFTHYCGKSRKGYFKVKRRTSRKKFGASLRAFSDWARKARHKLRKGEMLKRATARVKGHLNYYAITDNARACGAYVYRATRILHRWLNRKSQRKAYNWAELNQALNWVGWPRVRIRTDLNPFRRAQAC